MSESEYAKQGRKIMGVNWAAGLMRWRPHKGRDGTLHALSHLHPFRFVVAFGSYKGMPPRIVEVHVGFSMHVFTRDVVDAGVDPEIYQDEREARAFDRERYQWSRHLKVIVSGLEARKCFHAKNGNFVTIQPADMPANREYRVFFSVRRKSSSAVELIVQSAYLGDVEQRPAGQRRKPVGFRVIVMEAIRGKRPAQPR